MLVSEIESVHMVGRPDTNASSVRRIAGVVRLALEAFVIPEGLAEDADDALRFADVGLVILNQSSVEADWDCFVVRFDVASVCESR
jgi:hypothetical protein